MIKIVFSIVKNIINDFEFLGLELTSLVDAKTENIEDYKARLESTSLVDAKTENIEDYKAQTINFDIIASDLCDHAKAVVRINLNFFCKNMKL
ncbi:hypothetical protein BpHYR1_046588 [Brachionus plicatilis]|uniref:Uncharacterized protein n=1 Tax=Brachionus plicatilis TaxID=10195 RepID=A0A3M7QHB0_BRAPC|nr:hypothetical protein BpHYR1_046588 [Brachionus plicatilis]